jgi:hypothetical protein
MTLLGVKGNIPKWFKSRLLQGASFWSGNRYTLSLEETIIIYLTISQTISPTLWNLLLASAGKPSN